MLRLDEKVVLYAGNITKRSESGIYHIMLRGTNRQKVFIDADDYEKFLQIICPGKSVIKE
jgi:hypothetical protein